MTNHDSEGTAGSEVPETGRQFEASEVRFRELFESANVGILMSDMDSRLIAVNAAFCAIVGYTESELLATTLLALTHPNDSATLREAFEQMVHSDISAQRMEKRLLHKDGQTIWADVSVSMIRDEAGRAVRRVITIADITARRMSEQELERSRSLQWVAGRLARVGGWSLELPTLEFVISEELKEVFNWPGRGVWQEDAGLALVPESHRESIAAALHACVTDGTPYDIEFPLEAPDLHGGRTWIRAMAEAQRDELGTIVRVLGATQDITELRRATQEARAVAERLTTTLESITDGFSTVDSEWRITYINNRAEELLGRPRADLLGRNLWDEFPSAIGTELAAAYHRAMRDGTSELIEEFYSPQLDAWFSLRVYPSPLGIAVFFQDLTEQRLVTKVLRDSTARLAEQAALLNEARDAIIVRDLDHRITYWNRSAERTFDWTADEAIGRSLRALLFPGPSAFDEATTRLLIDGEWHGEIAAVTRGGREVIVDCREVVLRDDGGQPTSILAIKTDITERKRLESQYLRAQRMESLGTMAGGLARDLNDALAPVMMATERLRRQEIDRARLSLLDTIASGARRATSMLERILSFAGVVQGRRLPVDVGVLLGDIERIAKETFPKTVRIVRREATDLVLISGDPSQLAQVLISLCANAREAMADGGTLVLAADVIDVGERSEDDEYAPAPGEYVRIRIGDDGVGIAPDVLEHVFEPFYATTDQRSGLGLSTSAGIIKSHGGFMLVETEPGKGSNFLVHLPAIDTAPPTPQSGTPETTPRQG